jgi:hypothetical protein
MRRRSANEQAVLPSHHRLKFDAASVQDGAGISIPGHAAQVFRVAFVMDRKLLAGVSAILRITISKPNGWLMIKSGAGFRMQRDPGHNRRISKAN